MFFSKKGSVLVVVIAGITILAAIGGGVATMVGSGARMGVDHSLSVQALYAAESGLEWAGWTLRKSFKNSAEWITTCEGLSGESFPDIGSSSFVIIDENVLSDGCEVTVTGRVGSTDNPLAIRLLVGKIPKKFITGSLDGDGDGDGGGGGGGGENFIFDEEVKNLVTGGNIKKELDQGNLLIKDSIAGGNIEVEIKHEGNVVIENSTAGGNIKIEIKGKGQDNNKVFIKNTTSGGNMEIEIKHEGDVFFENINTGGNIKVEIESDGNVCHKNVNVGGNISVEIKRDGNVCLKNVNAGGNISVEIKRDGDVCIQGSSADDIEIEIKRDGDVCVKNDTAADDIEINIKRDGSSCDETNSVCSCPCSCQFCDFSGDGGNGGEDYESQNPVGDGGWSEG